MDRVIDAPPEWGGIIPTEVFLEEGKRLVAEANKRSIPIRLLGGVAIRLHCMEYVDFAKKLGRLGEGEQEYTDLDYVSYSKFRNKLKDFFKEIGYERRPTTLSSAATQRQIYFHPKGWFYVDVFFDELKAANHPINFKGRLEADSPTVSPTELLLEKVQIVFPGEKDIKDTLLLVHAHQIASQEEPNTINGKFVAQKLASDWGFWYTVTTNLKALQAFVAQFQNLTEDEKRDLTTKAGTLLDMIEKEPKSTGWKMRSTIGTKKRWYEPVETAETVGGFGIWRLRERK